MCKNRASVSGWSPIGCEGFLHKFEHPKSTPYYFSFPLILSVAHIICVCVCLCEVREIILEKSCQPPTVLQPVAQRGSRAPASSWHARGLQAVEPVSLGHRRSPSSFRSLSHDNHRSPRTWQAQLKLQRSLSLSQRWGGRKETLCPCSITHDIYAQTTHICGVMACAHHHRCSCHIISASLGKNIMPYWTSTGPKSEEKNNAWMNIILDNISI